MNCANHADASAVAYCRTCGKALCANCTRPVRGVIYCEDCLGAKMEAAPPPPPTPYQQVMEQGLGLKVAPGPSSGPNPVVAGILAGFFPVGVGAVYTGQYAKGLAHLAIMALLIAAISTGGHGGAMDAVLGLAIGFFYFYQIIDSVRAAKAIQMSQPIPDPFGLTASFGGPTRVDTNKIPIGAVVLILVGVIFLLHTLGLAEFGLDRFWPLILIALGGWLFARNWGMLGPAACPGCQCARCRSRRIMGPSMMVTIGFLFLLENVHVANFGRTWPVILLVIGGIKLLQGSASAADHIPSGGDSLPPGGPIPPPPPQPVPPTSEVNRG